MTRLRGQPILLSVAAIAVELALIPIKTFANGVVGGNIGLLPDLSVVLVAAWLGGLVPALAATVAATAASVILTAVHDEVLAGPIERDAVRIILFVATALFATWLIWLRTVAEKHSRRLGEEALAARDRADLLARRLSALQALGADLAQAETTDRIVRLILDHGVAALLSDGAAVILVDSSGRLNLAGWRGDPAYDAEAVSGLDVALPLPMTDAVRTRQAVFIEDPAEHAERYGDADRRLHLEHSAFAMAAVPLTLEGRPFGVLVFTWRGRHELSPDRRAFIEAMARLAAGAWDRARLFDQERAAFRRLEAAQRRLDLLSEAGREFGLSLDYESTLRRAAHLAVPMLGDVCIVDIVEGEAVRRIVAVASEETSAAAAELEADPIRIGTDCPIARVLETGESTTYRCDIDRDRTRSHGLGQAAALRAIGARWVHVAPLRTPNGTIGALSFLRGSETGFDQDERAMAGQLADRAAHALDNARLHRRIRQLAERESHRAGELEAVIGAVDEGFLVIDADGMVQTSNRAAARLFGGPVPTLTALLERLIAGGTSAPADLPGEPTEYQLRHRPSAWVEVACYPVARAGLAGGSTVVVCHDVTAFRQGQALREAFMGLLSHELRTPVTTIYGGAAVLTRRGAHLDSSTGEAVLADIAAEADRLYRLVEDLLVLARFDEGFEVGREPVLLQRLVPAVVEQEAGRWPATRFDLDVASDLPAASGDETSITQVLRNLLSNASKYSGPNTTITVVVQAAPDGLAVRVLDEGPGIDPAEAEHLFDPFYRSPSTATLAGGAGIGLYVSRRLLDAMAGRIWAARRREGGSEFGFSLPIYVTDGDGLEDGLAGEVDADDEPDAIGQPSETESESVGSGARR